MDWVDIVAGRIANIPSDRVILKGTISEIMRCRYFGLGIHPPKVTLQDIVSLMALGDAPLVVNNLRTWLGGSPTLSEKYGVKLLDLLSWEIEVGNWYDMGYTVFDVAQSEFTLFNCRKIFHNHAWDRSQVPFLPSCILHSAALLHTCGRNWRSSPTLPAEDPDKEILR